jgi:hypothetical protein
MEEIDQLLHSVAHATLKKSSRAQGIAAFAGYLSTSAVALDHAKLERDPKWLAGLARDWWTQHAEEHRLELKHQVVPSAADALKHLLEGP